MMAETAWVGTCVSNPMGDPVTCDNRNAPAGAGNTTRGLTHSSELSREGLAMKATRKRGIDPAPTAPRGLSPELMAIFRSWPERFRSKVHLTADCWEWTACKDAYGYGRYGTTRARGTQGAHRMSLELTFGEPVPSGESVDHLCRNTSCVRPDHLEVTGQGENVRRGAAANASGWCRSGRHEWVPENIITEPSGARRCRPCRDEREYAYRPPSGNAPGNRTHCPQGHPYDDENTYHGSDGSRGCRACHREQERVRYRVRKGAE